MAVSNKPQTVNSSVWYYENKGSIEIIIDAVFLAGHVKSKPHQCLTFKIRKSTLKRSLKRMG
jgi:hypothetical protein